LNGNKVFSIPQNGQRAIANSSKLAVEIPNSTGWQHFSEKFHHVSTEWKYFSREWQYYSIDWQSFSEKFQYVSAQ
jgi:hypothetical protein